MTNNHRRRDPPTSLGGSTYTKPRQPPGKRGTQGTNPITPYSNIIEDHVDNNEHYYQQDRIGRINYDKERLAYRHDNNTRQHQQQQENPIFGTSSIVDAHLVRTRHPPEGQRHQRTNNSQRDDYDNNTQGSISTVTYGGDDEDESVSISDVILHFRNWLINLIPPKYSLSCLNKKSKSITKITHNNIINRSIQQEKKSSSIILLSKVILRILLLTIVSTYIFKAVYTNKVSPFISRILISSTTSDSEEGPSTDRPSFVYNHPYVTSSYYISTSNTKVLEDMYNLQVLPKVNRKSDKERGIVSRLAILRPFCEFDADALPTTFACWNSLVPCRAAEMDLGEEGEEVDEWVLFDMSTNGTGRHLLNDQDWECEKSEDDIEDLNGRAPTSSPTTSSTWSFRGIANSLFKRCKRKKVKTKEYFDDVPADGLRTTSADLFLFYSQTFSENEVAMHAVDEIMTEFYSVGGWSRCFDNIYAVEANIPKELDLYIPAAQEELYSWVNGPNRQYEAGFRIIQSGEWGDYDGFYLMEGDSVPVKNYWLDVILGEINAYRPFAVLGAQYDGDKWDAFYEDIPISLLHHTNGNGIYNTSHPLLERLTGQLEVEAPCPYNSIPYDYRMSQMWVEGTLGIVPQLAPKIMLNNEGENITLSDNLAMFSKWANEWKHEEPYRFTKAIHNYAATNLIPRHLGPEYVIHGAKLYSPWDPVRTEITLVISEWFFDRSLNLIKNLDQKDHPFSKVIIMIPPSIENTHDYTKYTSVPVQLQFRDVPDFMDLCSAEVKTDWFMITNSYHQVAKHVDLMFTPGKFNPVIPFTPATFPFCLKYPYCKEIIMLESPR